MKKLTIVLLLILFLAPYAFGREEVGGKFYTREELKKSPEIFEKEKDEQKARPDFFPGRTPLLSHIWKDKTKSWDGKTEYYATDEDRDRRPQRLILPMDPEGNRLWVTKEKYWKWPTTREIVPPDVYKEIAPPYGASKLSEEWHKLIGLQATELTGKIAPEIKPGLIITQGDLKNYPGLKELLPPSVHMLFDRGYFFSLPQMEIVPTRDLYLGYNWLKFSGENLKNCKVDTATKKLTGWRAATPFPRPKTGLELIWNIDKHDIVGDNLRFAPMYWDLYGRDGKYERTYHFNLWYYRQSGRAHISPMPQVGENKEGLFEWMINYFSYPQDIAGMTLFRARYDDPDKPDLCMAYVPSMRRVRKISGTDVFDPLLGGDMIWEDFRSMWQKISPTVFPMEYKILEKREYLMPSSTAYGYGRHYPKLGKIYWCWERRPVYVVEVRALDPTYIYSKRILYIDMETFYLYYIENYDRKGKLWRTWLKNHVNEPDTGLQYEDITLIMDHMNKHVTVLHFTPSLGMKWITQGLINKFFSERGR